MKDGDIYFWRWKSHDGRRAPYHCKSGKGVVHNGVLRDTFWSRTGDGDAIDLDEVDAEYQGNVNEMSVIDEREIDLCRPEDVVDMRHSNSSAAAIYLKPGAGRDADAMTQHFRCQIEREESAIRTANDRIGRLLEALELTTAGRLEEVDRYA